MSGDFTERRDTDRRSVYGDLMIAAFTAARRPLGFADLSQIVEGRGATLSDVADWLATARASGLIVDEGFETAPDGTPMGPRLFVLAPAMRAAIRVDRRRVDRRAA